MSFFTYTSLWVDLVTKDVSLMENFSHCQNSFISLIVNFGLMLILIFNYIKATSIPSKRMFLFYSLNMLLAVLIYAHSSISTKGSLDKYIVPISCEGLGFFIHILFLLGIGGMKYACLKTENLEVKSLRRIQ